MDITSAALATLISAITSAIVALLITKSNTKKSLDDQLDGILKIAIQFPYLESRDFAASWTSKCDKSDEKIVRYDVYCTLLFNYLSRVSSYYKFNQEKIEKNLALKDWARIHKNYWHDPLVPHENTDIYDSKFVDIIEKSIR